MWCSSPFYKFKSYISWNSGEESRKRQEENWNTMIYSCDFHIQHGGVNFIDQLQKYCGAIWSFKKWWTLSYSVIGLLDLDPRAYGNMPLTFRHTYVSSWMEHSHHGSIQIGREVFVFEQMHCNCFIPNKKLLVMQKWVYCPL